MWLIAVPDEREAAGHVATKILEKQQNLGTSDVVAIKGPIQTQPAAQGRNRKSTDRGEPIVPGPLVKNWRLAPRRPCTTTQGLEHEAGLVKEDHMPTGASGVFLYGASAPFATALWLARFAREPGVLVSGSSNSSAEGFSTRARGGSSLQRSLR
jgi:hypothetical protein